MCVCVRQVRVADVEEASNSDCSEEFFLMASEEAPGVGDVEGPYLIVTSPADGDFAEAGEAYTVEVSCIAGLYILCNVCDL